MIKKKSKAILCAILSMGVINLTENSHVNAMSPQKYR